MLPCLYKDIKILGINVNSSLNIDKLGFFAFNFYLLEYEIALKAVHCKQRVIRLVLCKCDTKCYPSLLTIFIIKN